MYCILTLICTLLGLQHLSELVDKAKQKKLFAIFSIEISPKRPRFGQPWSKIVERAWGSWICWGDGVTEVSHLVHWSVLGRLVDYLSPDQQSALFSKFQTSAARKQIKANNFAIAGDLVVRHLSSYPISMFLLVVLMLSACVRPTRINGLFRFGCRCWKLSLAIKILIFFSI